MSPPTSRDAPLGHLRYIPLSYNTADSHASALRLVLSLIPHWEQEEGQIEFIRFKDGITNTVGMLHGSSYTQTKRTLSVLITAPESGEKEAWPYGGTNR